MRSTQALLQPGTLGYAGAMASEHMIEAIGNLEWAVARLEEAVGALPASVPATAPAEPAHDPALDREAARAALRSLDALIGELKGETRNG